MIADLKPYPEHKEPPCRYRTGVDEHIGKINQASDTGSVSV